MRILPIKEALRSLLIVCLLAPTLTHCGTIPPAQTLNPGLDLEFARSQFNAGHYGMAEYYLKKTLITVPDDPSALKLLPWSHFFQKRFDKALIAFENIRARHPRDPVPLIGMGWAYFGLLDYERALQSFDRAEQLSPDSFQVHKGKGFSALRLYEQARALKELEKSYSEEEVEQIMEIWTKWQGDKSETMLDIIPESPDVPTLFTLPVESPRYPSIVMIEFTDADQKLIDQAWELLRNKKYAKALKAFTGLPAQKAKSLDARNGLAWSYLHTGQIKQADAEFQDILRLYPWFAGAHDGIKEVEKEKLKKASFAHYYTDIGKYTIAQNKFAGLAAEYPKWSHAYSQLGWIGIKNREYNQARDNFQKALQFDPTNKTAQDGLDNVQKMTFPDLYEAERAFRNGDYKSAARLYNDYIESLGEPSKLTDILANAYNGLGWSLFEKKQYQMAIGKFEKTLQYPKLKFDSAKGLGLTHFQMANYEKAAEYLQVADDIKHNHKDIVSRLDWSILRSWPPGKSENHFQTVLLDNPLRYSAYLGLGWINYKYHKPDLGVEYFIKAISLDPDFALTGEFGKMLDGERFGWQIYNQLGWAYYHRQRYARALELFKESLDRQPGKSETLKGIGYSLYRLGSYSQAITFLQQCLAVNPSPLPVVELVMKDSAITPFKTKTSVLTVMGRSYHALGKHQEAILHFNKELRQNPNWPEIHDGLGWSNLKLNRMAEAQTAFNQALLHQPLFYSSKKGLDEIKQATLARKLESATASTPDGAPDKP